MRHETGLLLDALRVPGGRLLPALGAVMSATQEELIAALRKVAEAAEQACYRCGWGISLAGALNEEGICNECTRHEEGR